MPLRQVANRAIYLGILLGSFIIPAMPVQANMDDGTRIEVRAARPKNIDGLLQATAEKDGPDDTLLKVSGDGAMLEIRKDAMREAGLSYGARGGMAWRAHQIMNNMRDYETVLDRVFNFNALLINAPSGMLIEPPIITRSDEAFIVTEGGTEAAVTDRIYQISHQAKIIPVARRWQDYLMMSVDPVTPPPKILWPENKMEEANWDAWVRAGWEQGVRQADEIFQDQLNRLTRDFNGMVRYRLLLAQGMVSEPFALLDDRGVTGDGQILRIGDRAIRITGPSQFRIGTGQWRPADR